MAGGDWRRRAACRDVDPELFFPPGNGLVARAQTERARAVCAGCPVVAECLSFAMRALPEGIAGGLTPIERANIRRRGNRIPARVIRSVIEERRETAGRLRARGWPAAVIARQLGVNERSVYRLLKRAVA